jgi:hypothetical protein
VVGDKVFENVTRSFASEKKGLLLSHSTQAPISTPSKPIGAAFFVATPAAFPEPWHVAAVPQIKMVHDRRATFLCAPALIRRVARWIGKRRLIQVKAGVGHCVPKYAMTEIPHSRGHLPVCDRPMICCRRLGAPSARS